MGCKRFLRPQDIGVGAGFGGEISDGIFDYVSALFEKENTKSLCEDIHTVETEKHLKHSEYQTLFGRKMESGPPARVVFGLKSLRIFDFLDVLGTTFY